MNSRRKSTFKGIALLGSFAVVLILLFLPLFQGQNALEFLDNLYNSISKGSANYLPNVREEIVTLKNHRIHVSFFMNDERQALETAQLFQTGETRAYAQEKRLEIDGDMAGFLLKALDDAEKMYANEGEKLRTKYGYDELRALYNWWSAFKAMDSELNKQQLFKEAKIVSVVQNKAIEPAYNYYGIEAKSVREKYGVMIASLLFYVVYTLWYGFGVLYLFEGLGLKLGH